MEHYCYDLYGARGNLTNSAILGEFANRLAGRFAHLPKIGQSSSVVDRMDAVNPRLAGVSSFVLRHNMHLTIHTFSELKAVFVDYFGDLCPAERASLTQKIEEFFVPSMSKYRTLESLKVRFFAPLAALGQHVCYERTAIDLPAARELVDNIMAEVKMRPLERKLELMSFPLFEEYDLLQPIVGSHIAVHTHGGKSLIDVFSCEPFNSSFVSPLVGGKIVAETTRGFGVPSRSW